MLKKIKFNFKKNNKRITLVISIIFLILFVGFTYAYFELIDPVEEVINKFGTDLNDTDPYLYINGQNNLSFKPNASNLLEGSRVSYTESSEITATLIKPKDSSADLVLNYNVYLSITENTYVYGENFDLNQELIPELLLNVRDEKGLEVTEIKGLEYRENVNGVEGLNGFDVTAVKGMFAIAIDQEIGSTTESRLEHNWTFDISMVNLPVSQYYNVGKTLESKIIISTSQLENYESIKLKDAVLLHNGGSDYIKERSMPYPPNFSVSTTTDAGMYATEDMDGGNSYYFRGAVEDNYVSFADTLWRIIRIDEYGNIKMISQGNLGDSVFNTKNACGDDNLQPCYKYHTTLPDGTSVKSDVLEYLDNVFAGLPDEIKNKLVATDYCMDYSEVSLPEIKEQLGLSSEATIYGGFSRLINGKPTLACAEEDRFNGFLGLISLDEIILAGMGNPMINDYNPITYLSLSSDSEYWAITPAVLENGTTLNLIIDDGFPYYHPINDGKEVHPVVALNANIKFTGGDGTEDNPYLVSSE